ncbi:hypothetical protein OH76DRAFT_1487203 [Lentinus brumalis]|uniref:Uncharacterized protein n=1 Tax=Lentinus brumalis TaxID=2498619 RepID=A0A371CVE1_9APHY|nr:hypothetical protein OH76DRAFT_1487203 [Polyporus brumalis]
MRPAQCPQSDGILSAAGSTDAAAYLAGRLKPPELMQAQRLLQFPDRAAKLDNSSLEEVIPRDTADDVRQTPRGCTGRPSWPWHAKGARAHTEDPSTTEPQSLGLAGRSKTAAMTGRRTGSSLQRMCQWPARSVTRRRLGGADSVLAESRLHSELSVVSESCAAPRMAVRLAATAVPAPPAYCELRMVGVRDASTASQLTTALQRSSDNRTRPGAPAQLGWTKACKVCSWRRLVANRAARRTGTSSDTPASRISNSTAYDQAAAASPTRVASIPSAATKK